MGPAQNRGTQKSRLGGSGEGGQTVVSGERLVASPSTMWDGAGPVPFGTELDDLRTDDAEFMGHVTSTVI
jgi:hypothetical protein